MMAHNIINGTPFDDILYDTPDHDTINGFGGNDEIEAFAGGSDTLNGWAGDDELYSYDEDDILDGGSGVDLMNGGDGNDIYYVDHMRDVVEENFFGGGVDTVWSSVSYTLSHADKGIEHLILSGVASITGTGNGLDNILVGNSVNNVLVGNGGADQLFGGNGNDYVNGGIGNDVLNGGAGIDYADYTNGTRDGQAFIGATAGVTVNLNLVWAQNTKGAGLDTLVNIENINATNFNDSLTGNASNNVFWGKGGNDQLSSGSGNDTLIGGDGRDTFTGGTGNDKFVYKLVNDSPAGAGRDVIKDFKGNGAAIGDQIDLTAIDANVLKSGNQAFIFGGPFTAGHLRYNTTTGILSGNTDSDAAAEFEIQLLGAPALVVGGAGTDILL